MELCYGIKAIVYSGANMYNEESCPLSANNEVVRSRPDIGPGVSLTTNQTCHRSSDTVTITRRYNWYFINATIIRPLCIVLTI